jgi:hypothetical protein
MPEYYNPNSEYEDPLQPDPMPPGTTPTTAPNIDGPVTLDVSSFNDLTNCQMMWRQGDTQPDIVLQMLANGTAVDLSGATVTINFVVPGQSSFVQTSVMSVGGDNETCSYARQPNDYTTANDGRYYFAVKAVWPDGTGFTGPDNGEAILTVNSAY